MNYLAHIYLSGEDEDLMIGNFIADSVRGNQLADFPEGVRKGIVLHRKIDSYTDRHPVVTESKNRLRPEFGKWPPVIVDVFYDHFLAAGWEKYHAEPLPAYSKRVYKILKKRKELLPERVRGFLPYMIYGNWLVGYSKLSGVEQALRGMSRRSRFNPEMHKAVDVLKKQYEGFQDEFERFFLDLQAHVAE
ncbi:MAG TPA: ACP phosphodiesterase [Leptospiraceae bacterium]|jgi:acyl carrier protein phosphodiesterase|nr:acyl carrier protein phosphodiesterase [Leptospirales bacterium]HMW61547.1 ACP phosphodiesterase [Leptospiraceae bacterium]HMX56399.1 ACP phosphodiesterase [Leptospiraceae bacterium]HMZ36569.1 ACP phosphodiesterase [Leptospiraceae bacterium]HNE24858.1 ACP phosphodiesterase [Leptospiraceae bacterium]